jgi:hypothetical protein
MTLFNPENITKRSDLINNDSLSGYMGFAAQQNHNTYEVIHNLLSETKPARILEIGTALGGLTGFLSHTCKILDIDCSIRSYDIHYNSWYEDLKKDGVDIRIENIFGDRYSSVPDEVVSYIKSEGLTLVLCDGGSKKDEFRVLSQHLKNNDIIMTHDYGPNLEYFNEHMNNKIWNWLEIQDCDIIDSCRINGLVPYMNEPMLSVAWACFRKIGESRAM